MRFRSLALFPLVYAVVVSVVALVLVSGGEEETLRQLLKVQLVLVRVLAIGGCLAAVSAFSPGDHLRRAWLWLMVSSVAVLVRDLIVVLPWGLADLLGSRETLVLRSLAVVSNVALLGGVWLLARSSKVASISLPGGRRGVILVTVLAAVLALTVAGPGAVRHARELGTGDWSSIILLVSAVVDILSLCLLAPLLLTAVALRGGVLAWPWSLVTASMASWLLYDAAAAFGPLLALGAFPLAELFRGLAENYLFAAGVAQRLAVREIPDPSAS